MPNYGRQVEENKQTYTGYKDNNDQENSQNFYHLNTVLQRMTLFYQNEKESKDHEQKAYLYQKLANLITKCPPGKM